MIGDGGWERPQILTAMERSPDVYFDVVSQIHMDRWTHGRIGLVGDAAFAPSLLAGQGAALAMIAAYVMAGEMASTPDQPEAALGRYEAALRPFMGEKQRSALRFARSFAPRTALGLWFRNQMTRAFSIPGVAKLTFGTGLLDRIQLPNYPALKS
jgi:2-polyprenyl-6-methoxyphenol hydroxylase-like FAD-dependent oxidoreductase